MTKTYGTITGLVPARGGKLYLTNVSGDLLGLELPITISGASHPGRFSTWELYVDGVKVDGLVPCVRNGKFVIDLPYGMMLIVR